VRNTHRFTIPGCSFDGSGQAVRAGARLHALGALALELDADDLAALGTSGSAGAAAEDRYPEPPMAILDSERA